MSRTIDTQFKHLTMEELEAGLDHIRESPNDDGVLKLIVRRPQIETREVIPEGNLDVVEGLVGDSWMRRGSLSTLDGSRNPEMQINIMNSRVVALVAQDPQRWQLAGDQLFLDLNLSKENLPVGARLSIGAAVLEVTAPLHTGCRKFVARFGVDAMKFVNSAIGRELCLRGINAKVVQSGVVRVGQTVRKL